MAAWSKNKRITGIYKITSPSGKVYIGQSIDIRKRFMQYTNLTNCKTQRALYNSLLKYGSTSHDFLILHSFDECVSQECLDYHEIFYIQLFKLEGLALLNIKSGGSHGRLPEHVTKMIGEKNRGRKMSEEFKRKMSSIRKGKKIGPMSEEHKEKIRQGNLGKVVSVETLQKMSEANKGRKPTEYTMVRRKEAMFGYKHSEETKLRISIANKGRKKPRFASLKTDVSL